MFSVFLLVGFVHVSEALFFGPIAVGLLAGALALKGGFLLGAAIAGNRSHGRSAQTYQIKDTVHGISRDPRIKEGHAKFTLLPLKLSSQ